MPTSLSVLESSGSEIRFYRKQLKPRRWREEASGRWQKTTAASTCKADSAWRLCESAVLHPPSLPDERLLSDGMCSYTLVLWKLGSLLYWPLQVTRVHPSASGSTKSKPKKHKLGYKWIEVTGLGLMAGAVWRGRIEGGRGFTGHRQDWVNIPPLHSDLLVIYLMERIQWRAEISTVTFYPHQMFSENTIMFIPKSPCKHIKWLRCVCGET